MPQPTPFSRLTSFTDFEADHPSDPPPGASLDAEYDAIAVTVAAVLANLARIQRDDGALANNSVGLDQLTTAVLALLSAAAGWTVRGAWVTATNYAALDLVKQGTATYVCAVAHTSGVFATDFAANDWVLLFDTAGATPADGSVTSAKLADGAVTDAKVGFTTLDLTGAIRGQGGIAAGTAANGSLLHAKGAAGVAYAKVERTTDAQGAVGYQIIGVTKTWTLEQALSGSDLIVKVGSTTVASFLSTGGMDMPGTVRATAGIVPTTGAGIGLNYISSIGYVTAFNYTAGTWSDLKVRGKIVYLTAGGVDVLKVTSTGVDVLVGSLTIGGSALGYLGMPQTIKSTAYTLVLGDQGKHIYSSNVAGQNVTVPTNAAVAFPIETSIVIINDGTNPITVVTTGIVIRLAGTATVTGNRTIAAGGMAFLVKVGTNRWFISGTGVS